jgi:TPR repeat protein
VIRRLFQRVLVLAATMVAWGGGAVLAQAPPEAPSKAPLKEAPKAPEPTLEETLAAALGGDAGAQLSLAVIYEGLDAFEDAARWYRKAADQGKADAQFKLGYFHTVGGGGLARDLAEAARWYEKAVAQNQPGALYNLAVCFERGLGVTCDESRALSLYKKAAALGDTYAQKAVGVIHHKGRGVKADAIEAYAWYLLSASQGNPDASRILKDVEPTLAAKDLEQARVRGAELSLQIYKRTLAALRDPATSGKAGPAKGKGLAKDFLQ